MRYLSSLIVSLLLVVAPALAEPIRDKASAIFDPGKIHEVHVEVSQQGWKVMQPRMYSMFSDLFGSSTRPTTKPSGEKYVEGQRLGPNLSALEYAYVKATISIDGETVRDVGLRMKGNSS